MDKLLKQDVARAVRNHKYEMTGEGIYIPSGRIHMGGHFVVSVNDGPEEWSPNLVTTEGLNNILDVYLHGSTQTTTWYVALFKGNVSPAASWTGANFTANSTEMTEYDEATRVAYVEGAASAGSIDNLASRAVFTANATVTAYGAALLSASAKSATTGVCFASSRFSTSRSLADNDVLNVGYAFTATSV